MQIYNLAPEVRRDLNKDYFQFDQYRQVVFAAGYASDLPLPIILKGNIQQAYSYRQGPDWITEIVALDGGFGRHVSQINYPVPTGYQFKQVLTDIVKTMNINQVGLGVIGNFVVPNSRGIVFCGNTWDLLVQTVSSMSGQITINKEKVYIMQQNEYVPFVGGVVDTIDASNGLLESPRHQLNLLLCKMIFEPRFEIFQKVQVDSIEPGNSGTWKVNSVVHSGTISGAVCENLNTEVTLFRTGQELVPAA